MATQPPMSTTGGFSEAADLDSLFKKKQLGGPWAVPAGVQDATVQQAPLQSTTQAVPAAPAPTKEVVEVAAAPVEVADVQAPSVKAETAESLLTKQTGKKSYVEAEKNEFDKTISLFNLPEEDRKELTEGIKGLPDLDGKLRDLKARYDSEVDEKGEQRALAGMFALIGHVAVGLYGVKHGVDTSGIKFDPTDWALEYKKTKDKYDMGKEIEIAGYDAAERRRNQLLQLTRMIKDDIRSRYEKQASEITGTRERQAGFEFEASKFNIMRQEDAQKIEQRFKDELLSGNYKQMVGALDDKEKFITQKAKDVKDVASKIAAAKTSAAKVAEAERLASELGIPSYAEAPWTTTKNEYVDQVKAALAARQASLDTERENLLREKVEVSKIDSREKLSAYATRKLGDYAKETKPSTTSQEPGNVEVERKLPDGKTGIFDRNTKKFLRYK